MDFATLLRTSARHFRDNVAVWHNGREQSYSELFGREVRERYWADRAERVAGA